MGKHSFVTYTEEENVHVSHIRELIPKRMYEVVAARKDSETTMEFVHTFIDLCDYSEQELDEILRCAGYNGMEGFVASYADMHKAKFVNGHMDRSCDAWYIEYFLLVSVIMETIAGRSLPADRAMELVHKILDRTKKGDENA